MAGSLKPAALTVAQYPMALKPSVGYEKQLYVSFDAHADLGFLDIVAVNSGVSTQSVPDNQQLSSVPQELLAMLDESAYLGTADLVLTIPVVYADDTTGSGTATFKVPTYSQDQTRNFEKGHGVQVDLNAAKKVKSVTWGSITVVAAADAIGARVRLIGCPTLDPTSSGTFKKIGLRTQLNYDPKIPMPTAIQDGRDKGAYIKAGEIEIGTLEISAKPVTAVDGLQRYLGRRVTGWVKDVKEDKLHVQNIFFFGLYMSAKPTIGESIEPETWAATAMYERTPFIPAAGA